MMYVIEFKQQSKLETRWRYAGHPTGGFDGPKCNLVPFESARVFTKQSAAKLSLQKWPEKYKKTATIRPVDVKLLE